MPLNHHKTWQSGSSCSLATQRLAKLDHTPLFKDQHLVEIEQRRQPVGNHDNCVTWEFSADELLHPSVCLCIHAMHRRKGETSNVFINIAG